MQVAVITDIHGNALALDAVLADMATFAPDRVVCLGDAIQGGPQPAETVARLRTLACPTVMGNADAFLLTGEESGAEVMDAARRRILDDTREWSLAQLSAADRAFIAAFVPTVQVPLPGGRELLCFHGSPTSFDDVLLPLTPQEEMERVLGTFVPALLTGGHTHVQQIRHLGSTFYFNPGSVGFAYRHGQPAGVTRADPWAEYALVTAESDGNLGVAFRRVPFDVAAYREVIAASGMPHVEAMHARYMQRVNEGA